jgi:predicted ATPase
MSCQPARVNATTAESVAAGNPVDRGQVVEAVASLVAKSPVAAEIGATSVRYRLLDTTRAYGQDKASAVAVLENVHC